MPNKPPLPIAAPCLLRTALILSLMTINLSAWAQTSLSSNESTASTTPADGKRMDFAFQDVPLRALLQVLGETAGVNIVTDNSVNGTITLNLKNTTWQDALNVIARTKALRIEQNGGTIYVRGDGSNGGIAPNGGGNFANLGQPLSSESFTLQYQKADDVRNMIGRDGQRLLSEQGNVTADPITNQLIVQDTAERLAQIRNLISRIDKPGRQVMIEARIVEAEDSFSRSLGVKLGFTDKSRIGYTSVPDPANAGKYIQVPTRTDSGAVYGGNLSAVQNLSGQNNANGVGQIPSGSNSIINFPASSTSSGVDPASFAVSLFNSGMSRFINLELTALETDGKGKTLSNPRIVATNNIKAVIEQGTEIPYKEVNALGATNTSFRKASLKLEVVPQIAPNGEVVLNVDVTKDSIGMYTAEGYTINTKHVKTQVKIENGGTLVIGGIYQEEDRNSVDQVPLLGDIPLLGYLFKTRTRETQKRELLIFLTPHLLDARGNILSGSNEKLSVDE